MVVSGSGLASAVGRDVLRDGGNAVDAAVAVGFALAVVHPEAGNLGGGGFMLIRERAGAVHALDYRETAPARATRDMFVDARGEPTERSITGHLAAGVPGAVAGLVEAHRRYGRLPLARLIEPAIRLAGDGFPVDEYRSQSIRDDSARLAEFPASRAQLPARRGAAGSGQRAPATGPRHDAEGDSRPRRGRLLSRPRGRPDRRRDGARRRADLAGGSGRLPADLAGADRDPLPRAHHLLDASRVLRRRHAWARSSTSWKGTRRSRRSARPS